MTPEEFRHIAPSLPHQPGIYQYFDANGKLLYVGKAKDLRKRVSSYFTKNITSYKTAELVQRIRKIEFIVVSTEQDAFLLENNLIKQHKPVFNIDLKDDKTYPYIVIKNEPFPRIFLTRRKINDGSEYLGPFTSVGKVRELLDFIRQHIPLRNCKLNLSENNIRKGKFKVCLEYHLGNCKGPCEGLQTAEDYDNNIQQVKNILRGNISPVIQFLKQAMQAHVAKLEFEKAAQVKKKLEHLEQYQSKSVVVNPRLGDLDVCSIMLQEDTAFINFMMVRNGAIIASDNQAFQHKATTAAPELLAFAINYMRNRFNSIAPEVIVPFEVEMLQASFTTIVPKLGDKKKLLALSEKNVALFAAEHLRKQQLLLQEQQRQNKTTLLQQLQEDLHLPALPIHIECFDNSNFHGSYPVAAMVCFRNGEPAKQDYRHFNIKTVQGINDFASMKEVVYRRYRRLLDEGAPLPQLVIIDGGKGQLSAAYESILALGLAGKMTLIGLAKNVEEIFFVGDKESLKLSYNSSSLQLLRRIRDEVHRFGITFHRQKRSSGTISNTLEDIKGIGSTTADLLLQHFHSLRKIEKASLEELSALVGEKKAQLIRAYFDTKKLAEKENESDNAKKWGQDRNPAPSLKSNIL